MSSLTAPSPEKHCMTIDEAVEDVIAQLDEEEIDDVRRYPSPTRMHFGLGLWIRNNYVHSGRMGTVSSPDSLSWTVSEEIARKLLPEYAPYPLAFALLDDGYGALQSAHRFCLDRGVTTMVDAIDRHYPALEAAERDFRRRRESFDHSARTLEGRSHELDETYGLYRNAQAAFMRAVVGDVFNADVIREVEGSHDARIQKCAEDVLALRNYAFKNESGHQSFFVPAEIAYLADPALRGSEKWNEGRKALLWLLGEIPFHASEVPLPSWLFEDDGIALTALRMNGNLLAFMPNRDGDKVFVCTALKTSWPAYEFVDESLLHDRDVIRAAFECPSCGTVLADERFRQYRDDTNLVATALQTSGENLSWASARIQDDYDMVCLAIDHARFVDNIYESISERLRHDERIVAKIARREDTCRVFLDEQQADDGE
jgi:hypothetical protein